MGRVNLEVTPLRHQVFKKWCHSRGLTMTEGLAKLIDEICRGGRSGDEPEGTASKKLNGNGSHRPATSFPTPLGMEWAEPATPAFNDSNTPSLIALDFDRVCKVSPFGGGLATNPVPLLSDIPPTPGLFEFLEAALCRFRVEIISRKHNQMAIVNWFDYWEAHRNHCRGVPEADLALSKIMVIRGNSEPSEPAPVLIALVDGRWPSIEEIQQCLDAYEDVDFWREINSDGRNPSN